MLISLFNGDLKIAPHNIKTYGKRKWYAHYIYHVDNFEWCTMAYQDQEFAINEFNRLLDELDKYFMEVK